MIGYVDLMRDIDVDGAKRIIVRHTVAMLKGMGITPLCEGLETSGERAALEDLGVKLDAGIALFKTGF